MRLVHLFVSGITAHLADGVLQHDILLEQVVNGNLVLGVIMHRALEEEAQEALSAPAASTACEVDEQTQVKAQRSCEDRVAAQEVDLDLHGIAHPAEDVDIVPALLVIVAGRIVVDANLVAVVAVQVRLVVSYQDRLEGRELADLLGAEVGGLIQYETVAVAQDVGREPTIQTEHTGADDGSETALHQSLASLEVLAPAMGICFFSASSHMAGISTVVLGAPITKGASSIRAA